MHLELIQNTSVTEQVGPEVIDKLYDLSLNDPQQGIVSPLDNTSVVQGRLQVYAAYKDAVKYLVGIDPGDPKRFPDLYITVTNNTYFIRFKDQVVFQYCLDNYALSGSNGITVSQAEAINSRSAFWGSVMTSEQKSQVQTLEDFQYFTGVVGEQEKLVVGFSNATKIKFPSGTFTNNTNYQRYIVNSCSNLSEIDYGNANFYSRSAVYIPIDGNTTISEFSSSLIPNQNDFQNIRLFSAWTKLIKFIFPEGVQHTCETFGRNNALQYVEYPSTIVDLGSCYNLGRDSGHRLPCMVVKAVTPPDWLGWRPNDTSGSGNGLGWEQIPLAIYVPDGSVNAYKSFTNGGTDNEQLWARSDIKDIIKPLSELPQTYREMGTVTQADIDRT